MPHVLRLYEDTLPAHCPEVYLPRAPRSLYIAQGELSVSSAECGQHLTAGAALVATEELTLIVGAEGATLWRWELVGADAAEGSLRAAPASRSTLKLSTGIDLDPAFGWLMRCDRVSFPKGGVALTHVHQGPGIRCCLEGEITIETQGKVGVHPAGSAWFELGPAPVLAPTTQARETTFIRCFLLPRACKDRSSIRYVNAEDASLPKTQRYLVFSERFIDLP